MKLALGSIAAAVAASACCIGPVLLSAVGAGALGVAAVRLEPYRPFFLAMTVALLGGAYYFAHHRSRDAHCADGSCPPKAHRRSTVVLWVAALIVLLLVLFPYYVEFLV